MPSPLNAKYTFATTPTAAAFQRCHDLEATSDRKISGLSTVVVSRVLGHLLCKLDELQHLDAVATVAGHILNVDGDHGMIDLAQFYIKHFIRTFRRAKGTTPAPSTHPSEPEDFENERHLFMDLADEAKLDNRKAKKAALRRDGFRCIISRNVDWHSLRCGEISASTSRLVPTEAAHIIPESINTIISGDHFDGYKHNQAGGIWAMLSCFGCLELPMELNGNKIHRLENILTLSQDLHTFFDSLALWLKPKPTVPHLYELHSSHPGITIGLPSTILLVSSDDGLPLPDARLITLHALACEVAHMSAAAEHLEQIDRDAEELRVLAADGSSADLFSVLLSFVDPAH